MKHTMLISMMVVAAGFLAGCSGQSAATNSGYAYGGGGSYSDYKCQSVSASGQSYTGWATDRADAESNALAKCHDKSGGACTVSGCTND